MVARVYLHKKYKFIFLKKKKKKKKKKKENWQARGGWATPRGRRGWRAATPKPLLGVARGHPQRATPLPPFSFFLFFFLILILIFFKK
jgi:hypothetical protein